MIDSLLLERFCKPKGQEIKIIIICCHYTIFNVRLVLKNTWDHVNTFERPKVAINNRNYIQFRCPPFQIPFFLFRRLFWMLWFCTSRYFLNVFIDCSISFVFNVVTPRPDCSLWYNILFGPKFVSLQMLSTKMRSVFLFSYPGCVRCRSSSLNNFSSQQVSALHL